MPDRLVMYGCKPQNYSDGACLTIGLKVSKKSIPGVRWKPFATSLAFILRYVAIKVTLDFKHSFIANNLLCSFFKN